MISSIGGMLENPVWNAPFCGSGRPPEILTALNKPPRIVDA